MATTQDKITAVRDAIRLSSLPDLQIALPDLFEHWVSRDSQMISDDLSLDEIISDAITDDHPIPVIAMIDQIGGQGAINYPKWFDLFQNAFAVGDPERFHQLWQIRERECLAKGKSGSVMGVRLAVQSVCYFADEPSLHYRDTLIAVIELIPEMMPSRYNPILCNMIDRLYSHDIDQKWTQTMLWFLEKWPEIAPSERFLNQFVFQMSPTLRKLFTDHLTRDPIFILDARLFVLYDEQEDLLILLSRGRFVGERSRARYCIGEFFVYSDLQFDDERLFYRIGGRPPISISEEILRVTACDFLNAEPTFARIPKLIADHWLEICPRVKSAQSG